MINYCPNDYEKRNVKSRCEDLPLNSGEKKYSYLQDIPVHSQDTDLVYANVFCAICHDDFLNLTKSKGRFLIHDQVLLFYFAHIEKKNALHPCKKVSF